MYQRALDYLATAEKSVQHTSNKWKMDEVYDWVTIEEISNAAYKMWVRVYVNTTYDRKLKECVPSSWEVTWSLILDHSRNPIKLSGQERKKYKDEGSAQKYIAGRKKAYAKYFQEIYPPIPKEYAEHFMVNGKLLPGYRIEGEEV